MSNVFEGMMVVALCTAVGIQLYRKVKGRVSPDRWEWTMLITVSAGFVFGAVRAYLLSPVPFTFALYVIGAFLTYTAMLFSLPEGEKCNE